MVTRRLWLPIGLHMAWNTIQAGVFGTVKTTTGLYSITTDGPAFLTGGSAGPESSIVAIVLCLFVAALLMRVAIRRGNWVSMRDKSHKN